MVLLEQRFKRSSHSMVDRELVQPLEPLQQLERLEPFDDLNGAKRLNVLNGWNKFTFRTLFT